MRAFSAMCTSSSSLVGRTVIVTGCNTGIGKETAMDFYHRGARVIMACRDIEKAETAKLEIENSSKNGHVYKTLGVLIVKKIDLSSFCSIEDFARSINSEEEEIHILVNNAGVAACPYEKTVDGYEMTFATNHLGPFLLTMLLLPKITASAPGRIVNVSSMLHKWAYASDLEDPNFENRQYGHTKAYAISKLANILFTKELAKRLKEHDITNVTTYSLHPGAISTDINRNLDKQLFRGANWLLHHTIGYILKTPKQGAQTSIYCAVDELIGNESGQYYKECAVSKPSNDAEDAKAAKELWEKSLKWVKLENYNAFVKS